jgi:hypothetical protein
MYLSSHVIGVGGPPLAAGVDEGLVHVQDQDVALLCGPAADVLGSDEHLLVGDELAEVVLELRGGWGTVVKKRNCTRMPSSICAACFSLNNLRLTLATASLMNIEFKFLIIYAGTDCTRQLLFLDRREDGGIIALARNQREHLHLQL